MILDFQICFRFFPSVASIAVRPTIKVSTVIDKTRNCAVFALTALAFSNPVFSAKPPPLSDDQSAAAAANYQQYCALCHGKDRQGNVNDHAPSLRSNSLMTSGMREMYYTTSYGRFGTPMAAYLDEMGGPMTRNEIRDLILWLQSHVTTEPYTLSSDAVAGDISVGKTVYAEHCASCHGQSGEGGTGTALGNQAMLSLTTDNFLRYAIEHGRDGTEMAAFGETLSDEEIDGVTAFLRSRATGWDIEKPVLRSPPEAGDYVLNPGSPMAEFDLKDGLYVMSADLLEALEDNKRIVLLDTRTVSQWQVYNIEGSVPIPYYTDFADLGAFADDLPEDGTMIVTYCACPRAAAERVNAMIRELGFTNTAVLWEGVRGWVSFGYPVYVGQTTAEVEPVALDANKGADRAGP